IVQNDQTSSRIGRRSRFVKPDVSGTTDTEKLNVDTSEARYLLLISFTIGVNSFFRQCAVGNVDILFGNIDMIEQSSVHKGHITLGSIRFHGIILVQIKRDDIFKA